MQPRDFFKKASYIKFSLEKDKEMKQSRIEEIASGMKFKRCSETMLETMGFINPMESSLADNALSYVVGNWFLMKIQFEKKKVSPSEVTYEVQEKINEIEKRDRRKVEKAEKTEIKDKIYEEKAKTAPSVFSSFNIGFDTKGNVLINTTSTKDVDKIIGLFTRAFSEFYNGFVDGFSGDLPMVATKMLKGMNAEIPEGVELSLGVKGKGKNGGRAISFSQITSDDSNILSVLKGYDIEITNIELYQNYQNAPISYYVSEKGIDNISYDDDLKDYITESIEEATTEDEQVDMVMSMTFDLIMFFLKEYFIFMNKVIPSVKVRPEVTEKVFYSSEEITDFLNKS